MSESKVVLITGASSGMGRATAALLAERGYRVFGASRRTEPPPATGVTMLRCDVRDEASVSALVEAVLDRAGRVDAIVANAGYEIFGAAEEISRAEARAQFETNFFGAVQTVTEALPHMRRQGGGRVVIVSSLAGRMGVPFASVYAASKFALEGYAEALREEVRPFAIHVSLVEPGFFRTGFAGAMTAPAKPIPAYGEMRSAVHGAMLASFDRGADPRLLALEVARVLASPAPRLRNPVLPEARWIPRLKALMPQEMFAWGTRRRLGLNR